MQDQIFFDCSILSTFFESLFHIGTYADCTNFALVNKLWCSVTREALFPLNLNEECVNLPYKIHYKISFIQRELENNPADNHFKGKFQFNSIDNILFFACEIGFYDVIDTLIENGADINRKIYRQTPLLISCDYNNTKVVKTLLKYETLSLDSKNLMGSSALNIAIFHENINIINALISNKKMNLNLQDNYGRSALIHICSKNSSNPEIAFDIVKLLISKKTLDLDLEDNFGHSALFYVTEKNQMDILKLFKERKL